MYYVGQKDERARKFSQEVREGGGAGLERGRKFSQEVREGGGCSPGRLKRGEASSCRCCRKLLQPVHHPLLLLFSSYVPSPPLPIQVLPGKFNVLVTTYEFIMRDRSKLCRIDWKYMVIDEAQV